MAISVSTYIATIHIALQLFIHFMRTFIIKTDGKHSKILIVPLVSTPLHSIFQDIYSIAKNHIRLHIFILNTINMLIIATTCIDLS
jgi:hypothetical protein